MDLNSLTEFVNTANKQNWLSGIKATVAIVAAVLVYLETQAHQVTPELRTKILKRTPWVVAAVGLVLLLVSNTGGDSKLLEPLRNGSTAIFAGVVISAGLFAYGVHGIVSGRLIPRVKQTIGAVLAVIAIVCFFLFFHLSYKGYYHRWELFHYYMGSKYAKELGYTRIYACSAIADSETGNLKDVKRRKMRDLRESNLLMPSTQILADPEGHCKKHFTPERWEQFKTDMVFFRKVSGRNYWNDMQKDHGYNPPPVWTIGGHYLSILHPADDGYFKLMAAIDVTLTALLFIAIGWAFGWRVLIVAFLFWGTQEPAPFYWTGGAFLRQDWFFLAVLAACLARKRYFFWAGAALTYAALLRIFPVLLWAGPLVMIAAEVWRRRTISSHFRRLLAGGVVAAALLVPLSVHVAGVESYKDFFSHISVHQGTPLTNHMGLKTVLATEPQGRMKYTRDNRLLDPFERWKDHRRETFGGLKPLYFGLMALLTAAFVYTTRNVKSVWIAMGLSLVFVVSVVEATCYYYSIWILAALLTRAKRQMEWPLLAVFMGTIVFLLFKIFQQRLGLNSVLAIVASVGVVGLVYYYHHQALLAFARMKGSMDIAVIGLGGASQLLTLQFFYIDDRFTALSALYVAWTVAFMFAFFRRPELRLGAEPLPVRSA